MMKKGILAVLLVCTLLMGLLPMGAFAADTFTITYKTSSGTEMGTVTYTVGDADNAFPTVAEFSTHFNSFLTRARQAGTVAIAPVVSRWYSDQELTQIAVFPEGEAGQNYTIYCKFSTGLSITSVSNFAENKSYSETQGFSQPNLGVNYYASNGRSDQYANTIATFEKLVDGVWVEVEESYRTDHFHNVWPNSIYFSDVSDSGVYRVKYLRYTARDINGNVLFYDTVPGDGTQYQVNILPVELTITGVQAVDKAYDGSNQVELTGGALEGVLFGDQVSFDLGKGQVADPAPGEAKAVITNIQLTGPKAGNYVLVQPEGITVNITEPPAPNPGDDENSPGDTSNGSGSPANGNGSAAGGGANLGSQDADGLGDGVREDDNPNTGDNGGIGLWMSLILLSAAALTALGKKKAG